MPLSKLNQEQYSAATAPFGHNLIIASAGTGKTSTIVARIAHLLNLGTLPEKILLLTFTNKAAMEMIGRLERNFSKSITSKIMAGTFHSIGYKILHKLDQKITLKQPSELKTLLKSLLEQRKFYHISDIKPYSGAYLYDLYSLYQNSCFDGSFSQWLSIKNSEHAVFADIYDDVLHEFEIEKSNFGYVDFNDLLIKTKYVLQNNSNELEFDEVLVDEYQDTNTLQGSLIDSINTKSLFCVGDFDQSIYAFNGANIEIIGSFSTRYQNAKIYALNINYRSSSSILALANKVISNNPRLYPKQLIVNREGNFKPPRLLVYNELIDQYNCIADSISMSSYNKDDIAIIFRNNSSADGLEIALRERGISSKRKGSASFFESKEIKAVSDILSLLINPKDIMAFIHICEYARGIGSALAKDIFDGALKVGKGNIINGFLQPDMSVNIKKNIKHNYELGLFDNFDDFCNENRFKNISTNFEKNPILKLSRINQTSAEFLDQIYTFFKTPKPKNAKENIEIIRDSKLFSSIVNVLADRRATLKSGAIDLTKREQAVEKIYSKVNLLAQMSGKYNDVLSFFNFITLGSTELSEGDGVNLLSVHASKGLEFGLVFVVDLAQGRFPNFKLMSQGGNLEEERRLFYVAVTRAKDELILSYAKYDKIKKNTYQPSCFLIEAGMAKEEI